MSMTDASFDSGINSQPLMDQIQNQNSVNGTNEVVLTAFFNELNSLNSTKLPVSRIKIKSITNLALRCEKQYKHVVFYMEKFVRKCKNEYKLPTFYVLDSLLRKAFSHYNTTENIFSLRILKVFHIFIEFTSSNCSKTDRDLIIKVLNIWNQKKLLPSNILEISAEILLNNNESDLQALKSVINKYFEGKDINTIYIDTVINRKMSDFKNIISITPSSTSDNPDDSMKNENHDPTSLILLNQQFKYIIQLINDYFEYRNQVRIDKLEPLLDKIDDIFQSIKVNCNEFYLKNPDSCLLNKNFFTSLDRIYTKMIHDIHQHNKMETFKTDESLTENQSKILNNKKMLNVDKNDIKAITMKKNSSETIIVNKNSDELVSSVNSDVNKSKSTISDDNYLSNKIEKLDTSDKEQLIDNSQCIDDDININRNYIEAKKALSFPEFQDYIKEEHVTVLSDTIWIGRLPKNYPEIVLLKDINNFGEILNFKNIPTRGCAFVQMMLRSDAENLKSQYQIASSLNKHEYSRNQLRIAWAPPTDLKDMLKDFWIVKSGLFWIPWQFFTHQVFEKIKLCHSLILHCTLPPKLAYIVSDNDLLLDKHLRDDLNLLYKAQTNQSGSYKKSNNSNQIKNSSPQIQEQLLNTSNSNDEKSKNLSKKNYPSNASINSLMVKKSHSFQNHRSNYLKIHHNKQISKERESSEKIVPQPVHSFSSESPNCSRNHASQYQSSKAGHSNHVSSKNSSSFHVVDKVPLVWATTSDKWSPRGRISPPNGSTKNYNFASPKNIRSRASSSSILKPIHVADDSCDNTNSSNFSSPKCSKESIQTLDCNEICDVKCDGLKNISTSVNNYNIVRRSFDASSPSNRIPLISSNNSLNHNSKSLPSVSDKMISKLLQNHKLKKGANKMIFDRPLDKMKAAIFTSGTLPDINYRNHDELVKLFFNKQYLRDCVIQLLGPTESSSLFMSDELSNIQGKIDKQLITSLIDFYNQLKSGIPVSLSSPLNIQPSNTKSKVNESSNNASYSNTEEKMYSSNNLPPPPPPPYS